MLTLFSAFASTFPVTRILLSTNREKTPPVISLIPTPAPTPSWPVTVIPAPPPIDKMDDVSNAVAVTSRELAMSTSSIVDDVTPSIVFHESEPASDAPTPVRDAALVDLVAATAADNANKLPVRVDDALTSRDRSTSTPSINETVLRSKILRLNEPASPIVFLPVVTTAIAPLIETILVLSSAVAVMSDVNEVLNQPSLLM